MWVDGSIKTTERRWMVVRDGVKRVNIVFMRSSLSLSLTSSGCMQEVTDHSSPSSAGGGPPPLPELPSANILDTSFRKSWEES